MTTLDTVTRAMIDGGPVRNYYAPKPEGSDSPTPYIVIKHCEEGYYPTAHVFTQEVADKINELNGTTPAQVEAAIICSMFGCWQNFDKIAAEVQQTADKDRSTDIDELLKAPHQPFKLTDNDPRRKQPKEPKK